MYKIIVCLDNSEAERKIECEEENIRMAYSQLVREIENILTKYQIRYIEIKIDGR